MAMYRQCRSSIHSISTYTPVQLPGGGRAHIQIQASEEVGRLEAFIGEKGGANQHGKQHVVVQLGALEFADAAKGVVEHQRDGVASQAIRLGAFPHFDQRQIGRAHQRSFYFLAHSRRPVQMHALLLQIGNANQQAPEHDQMLPSPAAVVGASYHGAYPLVQRQAAACWKLAGGKLGGLCKAHVVVMGDDCGGGSVEDGEHAQGRPHAIGAVPQGRGREQMRGQETEIVGVAERGEQRRRGPKKPVVVVSLRGAGVAWGHAYRGVSCWSVYVCSERSSVDKRRSTAILESQGPGKATGSCA